MRGRRVSDGRRTDPAQRRRLGLTPGASSWDPLRALFQSALDAMLVLDDGARIVDANPAAAELCGEDRDDLIGRWLGDFTPPERRGRAAAALGEGAGRGRPPRHGRLARADGSEREVEYHATANFLPGRHLWMVRDVTDRNRALREAQFHADLLDHVEAAVVAVDPKGRVTHWNAAAERLYGVPRAEALGRDVQELVVAEAPEDTAREVIRQVLGGDTWEGEFEVRRRGGARSPRGC